MAKAKSNIVDVTKLINNTDDLLIAPPILTSAALVPDGIALSVEDLESILAKSMAYNARINKNIQLLFEISEFKIGAQLMERYSELFIGRRGELLEGLFERFDQINKKYEAIQLEHFLQEVVMGESQEKYEDIDSEDEYEECDKQYQKMGRLTYKNSLVQLQALNLSVLNNAQLVLQKKQSEFAIQILALHNQQLLASKICYNEGAIIINFFARESGAIFFQNNQSQLAIKYIEESNNKMLNSIEEWPWLEDIQSDVQKNIQFFLLHKQDEVARGLMEQYNQKLLNISIHPGDHLSNGYMPVLAHIEFLLNNAPIEIITKFVLQYNAQILELITNKWVLRDMKCYVNHNIEVLAKHGQIDAFNELMTNYNSSILKLLKGPLDGSNYLDLIQPCVRDNITLMLKNNQFKEVDKFIIEYIQIVLDNAHSYSIRYDQPCIKENASILLKYDQIDIFKQLQEALKLHKNADKFTKLLPELEIMLRVCKIMIELNHILGVEDLANLVVDYYDPAAEMALAGSINEENEAKDDSAN